VFVAHGGVTCHLDLFCGGTESYINPWYEWISSRKPERWRPAGMANTRAPARGVARGISGAYVSPQNGSRSWYAGHASESRIPDFCVWNAAVPYPTSRTIQQHSLCAHMPREPHRGPLASRSKGTHGSISTSRHISPSVESHRQQTLRATHAQSPPNHLCRFSFLMTSQQTSFAQGTFSIPILCLFSSSLRSHLPARRPRDCHARVPMLCAFPQHCPNPQTDLGGATNPIPPCDHSVSSGLPNTTKSCCVMRSHAVETFETNWNLLPFWQIFGKSYPCDLPASGAIMSSTEDSDGGATFLVAIASTTTPCLISSHFAISRFILTQDAVVLGENVRCYSEIALV